MTSPARRALVGSLLALTFATAAPSFAADPPGAAITRQEVLDAQEAWSEGLVEISKAYDDHGIGEARIVANRVIDTAYAYKYGPVLFKPTLTREPQTFRLTREGALSYFVGGDRNYPLDTGFALKHWRKVEVKNEGIQINGALANTMGKVLLRDKDGKVTTVDKTWTFKKTDDGMVRIILHHSSLPYTGPPPPCPRPRWCPKPKPKPKP